MQNRQHQAEPLSRAILDTVQFLWKNTFKIAAFFLVTSSAASRREIISSNLSVTTLPINPEAFSVSNAHIYTLMRFNQQCPSIYDNHENFKDIKLIAKTDAKHAKLEQFILSKINLDANLKIKLTPEQALAKKYRKVEEFKDIYSNDKKNEVVITTLFTESKLFKVLVKEFDINDSSEGGTYHRKSNTMTLLDKKPCNDAASTKRHESRHAFESTIASKGDPMSANDEISYPFNNASERKELEDAIALGDKFVTEHFKNLHTKAKSGKLKKGSREQKEYARLVKILDNYEPRCFWREDLPENFKFVKNKYMGGKLPMYLTAVFSTNNNTTVGMGTSVKDAENNKIEAFIADTIATISEYPIIYKERALKHKKNPEDMITMERAAAIFSFNTEMVEAFYEEALAYHVKREAQIAALPKKKELSKKINHKKESTEKIENILYRRRKQ